MKGFWTAHLPGRQNKVPNNGRFTIKKWGENGTPFGKKTAVLFNRHYRFNLSRPPHASLKEIVYPIKRSYF